MRKPKLKRLYGGSISDAVDCIYTIQGSITFDQDACLEHYRSHWVRLFSWLHHNVGRLRRLFFGHLPYTWAFQGRR